LEIKRLDMCKESEINKIPHINEKYLKLILKPKAYKSLMKYMYGKTELLINKEEYGVFLWDFERWCDKYTKDNNLL